MVVTELTLGGREDRAVMKCRDEGGNMNNTGRCNMYQHSYRWLVILATKTFARRVVLAVIIDFDKRHPANSPQNRVWTN